jgi:hypothetical protein
MFALLGDIRFDLPAYLEGIEEQTTYSFAEHALIAGKPRLQWTGEGLGQLRIDLVSCHAGQRDAGRSPNSQRASAGLVRSALGSDPRRRSAFDGCTHAKAARARTRAECRWGDRALRRYIRSPPRRCGPIGGG